MKKMLLVALLSSSVQASTYVKVLEDDSVMAYKDGTLKITLHQTLGDVPSVPCISGYSIKEDRPEGLNFWGKAKWFFKDAYQSMSWKRAAYGLGGAVIAGGAYAFGKKARREHYLSSANSKISHWWNKKK